MRRKAKQGRAGKSAAKRPAKRSPNARVALRSPVSGQAQRVKVGGPGAPATAAARPLPRGGATAFPIVAIGASAGGLEAFTKFFVHMSADSGMAFVLIPHLDPSHKSLMVELLARQTAMPVLEAAHRMPIRPNTVYVIPPNKYLAIRGGRLVLSRPPKSGAGQTPIDFALRSLAEDKQENAIGIVLSGTGSHGTAGLKEIKLAGGLVLVQDPVTAEHDQMPRSALESGIVVDYVLAPEKMPDALIAYSKGMLRKRDGEAEAPDPGILEGLDVILSLLETRAKHDFHHYRKNMILRRIQRRMLLLRIEDIRKYIERLNQDAEELTTLRRDLSIGVTEFFRESDAFNLLAARVVPKLVRRASAHTPVRIWVPACSTGEEAYSIAMLFIEQFKAAGKEAYLQMFASDISEESLAIARQGIYSESIIDSVSPERLSSFFIRIDLHRYQVSKQLRGAIVFAPQNLISDPPFSRLDLISCRNALIYFESDIQAKVISLLHYALKEGGYLLLGPTESIGPAAELFEPISKKWRIYSRIGPARHDRVSIPVTASSWHRTLPPPSAGSTRRSLDGVTELMQKLLLDEFMPAAVLVNRKYEILSVQGPVVKYLEIPPGQLTRDLMAMAREPLRARIRAICHKAIREGGTVRDANAQVRREGQYLPCSISVRPITEAGEAKGLLLIVFEDRAQTRSARSRRRGAAQDYAAMRLLEDELHATRDDLQRSIAELETSNTDLKSSNEEVMSMNEELQCANEELETSKEELQSLNEDLASVNSKLETKINDLNTANNDVTNLMTATDIAIVFLDRELRIKRFTPPAARLLNLQETALGRSFRELVPRLTDNGLTEASQHVIETGNPVDEEIRADDQRCYLRRVLPYRGVKDPIGVVVTFIDVTERVAAETQSRRFAAVLRDSSDAIALTDLAGQITAWNRGAETLYGYTEADAVKLSIQDLATEESRAHLRDIVMHAARGETVPAFEAQRRTQDGRVIEVLATVTLLRDAPGKPALLAVTERDITVRRQAAQQIRAILDATPDAVITIDQTGKIVTFNQSAVRLFGYSADDAIGQNVSMLVPASERPQYDAYLSRYRETREPHLIGKPWEVTACRKDGGLIPVQLSVIQIEHLGLFAGFIHDMTVAKTLQEEILHIAMLEQRRIGQELHDGTQQELTGLGLLAHSLSETLSRPGSEEEAKLAARLANGIAQANLHVRSLAHGLVPVPVDAESLPAALGELAKSTRENYSLACQFDCPEPVRVGDATTATHLYRIAQEAVGNAVKHAKASTISIRLARSDAELVLEIADNGVGIAPGKPPLEGAGLRLMEYRCAVIGGRFTAGRKEGGGTLVACAIPRLGGA